MAITDEWVTEKVATGRITIVKFAEHLWLLDARGVAYIPALDFLVGFEVVQSTDLLKCLLF